MGQFCTNMAYNLTLLMKSSNLAHQYLIKNTNMPLEEAGSSELQEVDVPLATAFKRDLIEHIRATHPDVIIPEDVIVFDLLSADELEVIGDYIAGVVKLVLEQDRIDVLTLYVDLLSVELECDEGPPKTYFHEDPENPKKSGERCREVSDRIRGVIDMNDYKKRQQERESTAEL